MTTTSYYLHTPPTEQRRVTYWVTMRRKGRTYIRRQFAKASDARAFSRSLRPFASDRAAAEIDRDLPYLVLHRHTTGTGWGRMAPLAFYQ